MAYVVMALCSYGLYSYGRAEALWRPPQRGKREVARVPIFGPTSARCMCLDSGVTGRLWERIDFEKGNMDRLWSASPVEEP